MFCKKCGRAVEDGAVFCSNCGTKLDAPLSANEESNFGFSVLGFLIPLAGLILFLVYESDDPKRAKAAGKGALIGFIVGVVLSIVLTVVMLGFTTAVMGDLMDSFEVAMDNSMSF